MTRILDIDLDFFVHGAVHWAGRGDDRPDADYAPPWTPDETIDFLERRCGLTGRLPGMVVTHHGELFPLWRDAIGGGALSPPFGVTHVDAHADLGLGDAGYVQIITDLLHRAPQDRTHPHAEDYGIGDGNWLAFAVACRWISDLLYVHNDEGGEDILAMHMENFDVDGDLQLKAVLPAEYERVRFTFDKPQVDRFEPVVPFRHLLWRDFETGEPFDVICLAQSPPFTPVESDDLLALIRDRFIDEGAFRAGR